MSEAKPKRGRKSKMRHEEEVFWGHDGTYIDIEGTQFIRQAAMEERGESPTQYEAPGEGDKMRALYALGLMDLSNGAKAVGTALIWHANSVSGRCDPGMQRLAYETIRCRRTVISAISELRRKGVLRKQRRGQDTNAYHINWQVLASKFQEFESRVTSVRFLKQGCKNLHLGSAETCTRVVQKPAPEPINLTHEENPCPERVISPSVKVTSPLEGQIKGKEEEGIQGEQVDRARTSFQPQNFPEGPSYAEGCTIVSGYCEPFHWDHLTPEDFEAAVTAELRESGAGHAVVNELALQRAKEKGTADG
jgi:hypothetical protein